MEYITIIVALILAPVIIKMADRGYSTAKKTEMGRDIKGFLVDEE